MYCVVHGQILFMLTAADAILGVNFFSTTAPGEFLKFDRAFVCMFRIAAGETWIEDLPVRIAGY